VRYTLTDNCVFLSRLLILSGDSQGTKEDQFT